MVTKHKVRITLELARNFLVMDTTTAEYLKIVLLWLKHPEGLEQSDNVRSGKRQL